MKKVKTDLKKKDSEEKKTKTAFFLEFLIGYAEKGTYNEEHGDMEKGKKSKLPCEDSVISTLVRKLRGIQKQTFLLPRWVGVG